jgi:hypothetical protein
MGDKIDDWQIISILLNNFNFNYNNWLQQTIQSLRNVVLLERA